MAEIKISELPSGTANTAAVVPATNAAGNATEKITLGAIAALAVNAGQLTTGTLNDARLSNNVVLNSDARLTDSRNPTSHKASHAAGGSDALSPADIGAAPASHSHDYATQSDIDTAVAALVNSAPENLNTLRELANALGSDANFSTTVNNSIAAKVGSNTTQAGGGVAVANIVTITQADYDNLASPDPNTLYFIQ